MSVCQGESDIARDAITSLLGDAAPGGIEAFILDDASPSRVGQAVVDHCASLGIPARLKVMPSRVGFRGGITRVVTTLKWIADTAAAEHSGRPLPYDLVVKLDPDSLLLRRDTVAFLAGRCPRRGIAGILHNMRRRDQLLFLADLLPVGFRRQSVDGVVHHKWEFRRFGPVWWSDIGRRALLNGFRFRYTHGALYVIGGETLQSLAAAGYLHRPLAGRHGFMTSEEDPMASVLTAAVGHPIVDLNAPGAPFGEAYAWPDMDPAPLLAAGAFLLHPLKPTPAGTELRRRFIQALEHARQAQSRSPLSAPTPG
jgi:hypothetical protein